MKRKSLILILSLVTLFAFTLAACSNPTGTDGSGTGNEDQTGGNGNDNDNGQTGDDPGDAAGFQFNWLGIEAGTYGFFVVLASEEAYDSDDSPSDIFMFYINDGEDGTKDEQIDSGTYTYTDAFSAFIPTVLIEGDNEAAGTTRFGARTESQEDAIERGLPGAEADTYEEFASGTMTVTLVEATDTYTFDWTFDFESGTSLSGTFTGSPDVIE